MQLISNGIDFEIYLIRHLARYPQVSSAVAWVSARTDDFKSLGAHKANVKRAGIGTHFCQTHPDVPESFVGYATAKFVLQAAGVFRPKCNRYQDITR